VTNDPINTIHERLDSFIKKYYHNPLVKGALLSLGGLTTAILTAAFLEYFGRFGGGIRLFMFYGFIGFALIVLSRFLLIPILKLNNIGSVISREEAARLIGNHFPEIQDKLLNTLQLHHQLSHRDSTLLLAGINQRINSLRPFKFSSAISIPDSVKKYGRYAVLPAVLFMAVLLFQSHILLEPVDRIVNYQKTFAEKAPFEFVLMNKSLKAVRNKDFTVQLEMRGKTSLHYPRG
jgi:hypothetical protein